MGEFEFYKHFEGWLDSSGFPEIYRCVRIHGNLETDVIGVRRFKHAKPRAIAVEVKESDLDKALMQAWVRRPYFNKVYVGMALKKGSNDLGYVLYKIGQRFNYIVEHGIGLLFYDEARGLFQVVNAKTTQEPAGLDKMLASLPKMRSTYQGVETIQPNHMNLTLVPPAEV